MRRLRELVDNWRGARYSATSLVIGKERIWHNRPKSDVRKPWPSTI
jgi:hypothetical protein